MIRSIIAAACFAVILPSAAAEPPRYTAIDITGWSDAQLDTLPFFKRLILNTPEAAPFGFVPVAASEAGHIAGAVDQSSPYAGSRAVLLRAAANGDHTPVYIDPFGTYSWGYWLCDGKDCHYNFGYVRDSVPSDMNWSGVMVGRASMSGSGEYSSGALFHAFRSDIGGGRQDLFPGAGASSASCINNRGEIAGYLGGVGAYRIAPGGSLIVLDPVANWNPSPRWINARGVIIGSRYPSRAFASAGGSATFDLPDLGGFETVTASDLNDSDWIVGKSGNFGDTETFATIWQPESDGTWTEFDLVEQLDTPDVLLESAIAIDNAGNIIARGHEDGTDFFSSRTYWLVPNDFLPEWCVPEIGLHPQSIATSGMSAEFSVAVVNAADVLEYQWRRDGVAIDSSANPSAATPTLAVSGLVNADSGASFDCVVTSGCGSVTTDAATLTVDAACLADLSGDGILDLADVNLFVSGFLAGDSVADLDGSGVFDLGDISLFIGSFLAGCP